VFPGAADQVAFFGNTSGLGKSLLVLLASADTAFVAETTEQLTEYGFAVEGAPTGADALKRCDAVDVILLDPVLPDTGGFELCRAVRAVSQVPVIVVSTDADEPAHVLSLELGADDHIARPCTTRLLTARIEAVVRRARNPWAMPDLATESSGARGPTGIASHTREIGCLRVDLRGRNVRVGDHRPRLTRKEFDVLALLSSDPGRVFHREQIMLAVWGHDGAGDTRTLGFHMTGLRKKLGLPSAIETIRGVGFRLVAENFPEGAAEHR